MVIIKYDFEVFFSISHYFLDFNPHNFILYKLLCTLITLYSLSPGYLHSLLQ